MQTKNVNIKDLQRFDTLSANLAILLSQKEEELGRQLTKEEIERYKKE